MTLGQYGQKSDGISHPARLKQVGNRLGAWHGCEALSSGTRNSEFTNQDQEVGEG